MRQVFKKTPEKHTGQENQYQPAGRKAKLGTTVVQHINDDGCVHTPDDQRMRFCQHF